MRHWESSSASWFPSVCFICNFPISDCRRRRRSCRRSRATSSRPLTAGWRTWRRSRSTTPGLRSTQRLLSEWNRRVTVCHKFIEFCCPFESGIIGHPCQVPEQAELPSVGGEHHQTGDDRRTEDQEVHQEGIWRQVRSSVYHLQSSKHIYLKAPRGDREDGSSVRLSAERSEDLYKEYLRQKGKWKFIKELSVSNWNSRYKNWPSWETTGLGRKRRMLRRSSGGWSSQRRRSLTLRRRSSTSSRKKRGWVNNWKKRNWRVRRRYWTSSTLLQSSTNGYFQLDAKKKEKDFLESEYNALYIKYKKIEDEMKSYNSEVMRYSNIIKPAKERVSRYCNRYKFIFTTLSLPGTPSPSMRESPSWRSRAAAAAAAKTRSINSTRSHSAANTNKVEFYKGYIFLRALIFTDFVNAWIFLELYNNFLVKNQWDL